MSEQQKTVESTGIVESTGTQEQVPIDPIDLKIVLDYVISSIGGNKFVPTNKKDRLLNIIDTMTTDPNARITGCKLYPKSMKADKTYDDSTKTVVMSAYINPIYIKTLSTNAFNVISSKALEEKLREIFDALSSVYGSQNKSKVVVVKHIKKDVRVPLFVEKNKKDFVYVKIVLKLPNPEAAQGSNEAECNEAECNEAECNEAECNEAECNEAE